MCIAPDNMLPFIFLLHLVQVGSQTLSCDVGNTRDLLVRINQYASVIEEKHNSVKAKLEEWKVNTSDSINMLNISLEEIKEQAEQHFDRLKSSVSDLQEDLNGQDQYFNKSMEEANQRLDVIGNNILRAKNTTDSLNFTLDGVKERISYIRKEIDRIKGLSQCPDGWVSYNRSCYQFSVTPQTFANAAVKCSASSAHLVYVENYDENEFIKGFLRTMKVLTDNNFWIGLILSTTTGRWVFHGTSKDITFTDFVAGEPSAGDDCLNFATQNNFQWIGSPCSSNLKFVCEKPFYFSKNT